MHVLLQKWIIFFLEKSRFWLPKWNRNLAQNDNRNQNKEAIKGTPFPSSKIHQKWSRCSGFGKGLELEPKSTQMRSKATLNDAKHYKKYHLTKSAPIGYQIDAKTSQDQQNGAQGQNV